MKLRIILAASTAIGLLSGAASAQTEIEWWHAMGGELGNKVDEIAAGFNATQSDYVVTPVYKGNYTETLTAAIAAFRASEQPHIVQVFEVGTATMMAAEGAVYPVYQLMEDTGEAFDPSVYLPSVTGYYTDTEGNMLSMPFNSSTPVMYYNKDAFAAAGLDPESPPKTWPELEEALKTVQANTDVPCGFTTAWQSWVHIENFSAWHNVPIGTQENGFAGLDTELTINGPAQVAHISAMADWAESDLFRYGGRQGDSQPLFLAEECAVYFNSSAGYAAIKANAQFDFGISTLPYWPEIAAEPQNSIIGGATLWVLQGHPEEDYTGVAQFFTYLSSQEVQADWHQFTGYLPITSAAYELTKEQGFYDANPGTEIAILQMTNKEPTENSKGLRFGNFVQIRDIINEELEGVWAGDKTAQEGLDAAVERGNELIRQFEADNS